MSCTVECVLTLDALDGSSGADCAIVVTVCDSPRPPAAAMIAATTPPPISAEAKGMKNRRLMRDTSMSAALQERLKRALGAPKCFRHGWRARQRYRRAQTAGLAAPPGDRPRASATRR